MGFRNSLKESGKKAAILVSMLGMLGFNNPVIAATNGEMVISSQSIESIDYKILKNAANSKTIFFGDSHWLFEDSEYVIHLLRRLKEVGFSYLGLEVKKISKEADKHSRSYQNLFKIIKKDFL